MIEPRTGGPGSPRSAREAPPRRNARIYALNRTVPPGEVATYGRIAWLAELSTPRLVGRALARMNEYLDHTAPPVPWHRIVNAAGRISARREGDADWRQGQLLRGEGVLLDRRGRVDFARVGWQGPSWEWLENNGYDVGALIARSQLLRRTGAWSRWSL